MVLSETHYCGNKKISLGGYKTLCSNRVATSGGGIATAFRLDEANHVLKLGEGVKGDEYLITRHSQFKVPINVINVYGECESRSSKDVIEEKWFRLEAEIHKIEMRGEYVVLCGDFNKHVGDIVKDNHTKVSVGGNLVRNFLANNRYTLLNSTNKACGGPFTRYNPGCPSNNQAKSCLDLCIVSNELVRYVKKVTIDNQLDFTPGRSLGKGKFCYSDHYAILVEIKDLPLSSMNIREEKKCIWNLNKKDGWENYKILTDVNENLVKITNNDEIDSTDMMKNFNKEVTKVKYKAFGKVTTSKGALANSKLRNLHKEKQGILQQPESKENALELKKIHEAISDEIITCQRENLDKQLATIKDVGSSKGRSAAVFHLKGLVIGKQCQEVEARPMNDPVTHEKLFDAKKIRVAAGNYCEQLLKNKTPLPHFEQDLMLKNLVHEVRMQRDYKNDEMVPTRQMYDEEVKKTSTSLF